MYVKSALLSRAILIEFSIHAKIALDGYERSRQPRRKERVERVEQKASVGDHERAKQEAVAEIERMHREAP